MARIPVDTRLAPERLRPAAGPVDIYAQPKDGYELAQLAGALKDFGVQVQRYGVMHNEKVAQEQTAKGEQKARELEEARISYLDAQKKGLIKPSDNPWFLLGVKQQMGRAAAGQYARALQAAIEMDPDMQASTEPADFDKFEQGFRKKWLAENVGENRDTQFERGFGVVDGYTMDEGRRFVAAAGARLEKRAGETLGVIVGQVLDQHYKEGPEVASQLVNAEIKSYLANNPKAGRIANLRAIESIADWARVNYKTVGKEDVEKLLRGIDAGTGKLYGVHEAKTMLNDVEKEIISMRGAAMNLEHSQETLALKKREDDFYAEIGKTLGAATPGQLAGMDLTPFISRLNAIDPDPSNAQKIQSLRSSLIDAKGNDAAVRKALAWVEGVNPERQGQFLTQKQLVSFAQAEGFSAGQYNTVVNAIRERERRAAEGGGNNGSRLLNDRMAAAGEQYIKGKMLTPFGIQSDADRSAAEEAVMDFQLEFLKRHEEITKITDPEKQMKFVADLAERAFILHANPQILKAHNKEQANAEQNAQAQTVFHQVMEKASNDDINALGQAYLDWKSVQNGDREVFSAATKALLTRLKVPITPDGKELKLFFLEWERNR